MGVLDTGGVYECVNAGGIWKVSVPSSGLSFELKMSLKKKKVLISWLCRIKKAMNQNFFMLINMGRDTKLLNNFPKACLEF